MTNNEILQAMAMDLKRVATDFQSGSHEMSEKFLQEVFIRQEQLQEDQLSENSKKVLFWTSSLADTDDLSRRAEDALLYSTLLLSFAKE